jgi:hypothetical protein
MNEIIDVAMGRAGRVVSRAGSSAAGLLLIEFSDGDRVFRDSGSLIDTSAAPNVTPFRRASLPVTPQALADELAESL